MHPHRGGLSAAGVRDELRQCLCLSVEHKPEIGQKQLEAAFARGARRVITRTRGVRHRRIRRGSGDMSQMLQRFTSHLPDRLSTSGVWVRMSSSSSGACPVSVRALQITRVTASRSAPGVPSIRNPATSASKKPGCGSATPMECWTTSSIAMAPKKPGSVARDALNVSRRSHAVSVDIASVFFRLATTSPRVMSSMPPENVDFSRLAPLATPRMTPWVLEKSETVWLVSDQSQ